MNIGPKWAKQPFWRQSISAMLPTPANLKLLASMLKERGYAPRTVSSGAHALEAARLKLPDLILLDVAMPFMDGFEVCERVKSDPDLKEIPILFISALTDTMAKVKAFRVGGDDYITKPFRFEEVEARVRTQFELRRQYKELQASYEQLRSLEVLRDNLTHMIVHDMRSLLMGITWPLDLAIGSEDNRVEYIGQAQKAVTKLSEMMLNIIDVSRLESGRMLVRNRECELNQIAEAVIDSFLPVAGNLHLTLSAVGSINVECDAGLVRRVLENLMNNALKFTPSEGFIEVSLAMSNEDAVITVRDNGRGIPSNTTKKFSRNLARFKVELSSLERGLGWHSASSRLQPMVV